MGDASDDTAWRPLALLSIVAVALVVIPALLGTAHRQRDVLWLNMTEGDVPLRVLEVQPDRFGGMGVVRRYNPEGEYNTSTSLIAVTALTGFDAAVIRVRNRVASAVDRPYAKRLRFRTGNGWEHEFTFLVMYPSANESYTPPVGPVRLRSVVPDAVMVTVEYADHTETVTMPVRVMPWRKPGPTENMTA